MSSFIDEIREEDSQFHTLAQLFAELNHISHSDRKRKRIEIEKQIKAHSYKHNNENFQTRVFEKHISRMLKRIP